MEQNARRLAEAVLARRAALGLSQEDVADRGGPSTTTQTKVEAGRGAGIRGRTARDLEDALQWKRGSIDELLAGRDAKPVDAPANGPVSHYRSTASSVAPPLTSMPRPEQPAPGSLDELRAQLKAVSRALQDAWEEYAYALQRVEQAQAAAQAALVRRHELQDQQYRLNDLIRSLEEDPGHDDTAASTRAGGSPAPVSPDDDSSGPGGDVAHLDQRRQQTSRPVPDVTQAAARRGVPDNPPDTTTGEESQDPDDYSD